MHVPADRLRKLQELYSESFAFCINNRLPQTVLGQCIVSYRKFIDHLANKYGFGVFDDDALLITVNTLTKESHRDKAPFGLAVGCSSISQAIHITKLALKRSTGDCFESVIKIGKTWCTPPVVSYIAESQKISFKQNCRVINFTNDKQETNHN